MKLDPAYQACSAMFIGSHLIATLLIGSNPKYFVVSAASYGVMLLLFVGGVEFAAKRGVNKDFQRQYAEWEKEVFSLSDQEAKRLGETALSDKNTFHVVEASPGVLSSDLSPSIRDFFSQYDEVRAIRGGLELSRKLLKPLRERYMQIGSDDDFVELAVEPQHATVYELESDGSIANHYPTIFHLVLLRNKLYN